MVETERDPQADLALCEAATPGPWESASGYSVREPEDGRGYGPIIASMDCKEHSVEQMVYNACFICESREALPYWIRRCQAVEAELAQSRREYAEEIDEFNAGYQAAKDGLPESAEPEHCPHDVWLCGYAWGAFEGMKAELDRLRSQLATQHNFQRGVECQFCGVSFDLPEPDDDGEVYRQHAMTCEKSPVVQEVERLRAENDRLREQSEESALARLRAWRAAAFGRWFNLENDVGCPDCLVLGELQGGGHQASRLVTASSDDEPHTEDKPASLGEMVTAALERWAELYGNQ